MKLFRLSKTKKQFSCSTKPFSQAPKTAGNQDSFQSSTIKQRGSIMWSIITALIYYYTIVPGWRLSSGDAAKIRGKGSSYKNLHRAA